MFVYHRQYLPWPRDPNPVRIIQIRGTSPFFSSQAYNLTCRRAIIMQEIWSAWGRTPRFKSGGGWPIAIKNHSCPGRRAVQTVSQHGGRALKRSSTAHRRRTADQWRVLEIALPIEEEAGRLSMPTFVMKTRLTTLSRGSLSGISK